MEIEQHDTVLVLRWDRQHVRNALDPDTIIAIAQRLDDAARDDACRAAVLTGTGDVAFSAGMDLKALAADRAKAGCAYAAWMATLNLPVRLPPVSAVNGMALG